MAEPTFNPAEAGNLNFRSRRGGSPAARASDAIDSLWWQIALGGFLALTAHSTVTGLYARYEAYQAIQELNREFRKATSHARPKLQPAVPTLPVLYQHAAPLKQGERCINGRRFSRLENGWAQVSQPC